MNNKGFTLVELLVVIAICGTVAIGGALVIGGIIFAVTHCGAV
jgi:prepilin-type N-terminal cleavage/methylation domain-containing protein